MGETTIKAEGFIEAIRSNVAQGLYLHKKVVPSFIIHVDKAGCLNEPHQEGLKPLMVLLKARAGHLSLGKKSQAKSAWIDHFEGLNKLRGNNKTLQWESAQCRSSLVYHQTHSQ